MPSGPDREELKVRYMAPGQAGRIADRPMVAEERPSDLSLSWRDNRRKRQHLTLPVPEAPTMPSRPHRTNRDALEDLVRRVAREEIADEAWHRR